MNNYKKPLIIYNPAAAGGRANIIFEKYSKILKESELFENIDVYESFSKENTIMKIEEIHKESKKYDILISIGGDGSISTVCNGLMNIPIEDRLPLLPLPAGSGNSLLRDFGIETIEDSIRNYKNNDPKILDALLVEEIKGDYKWYCFNVLGLGFISDIVDYVVGKGKKYGAFSYVLGIVFGLRKFRPYKTTIKYNDGKEEFQSNRIFFMTASNTKYSGGKIMIAPDAKYDDGLIDVLILHDINRLEFLNGFRKSFKGKHIGSKGCKYFKTNSLEIYSEPEYKLMPDGDLEGISPVKITVIPKQVKFIV